MPIYVLLLQNYKIPKIFNIKFPGFSIQNSQDFQFVGEYGMKIFSADLHPRIS